MATTIPYTSGSTTFTNADWVAVSSPASVELGTGWTAIGNSAFINETSLTSIVLPASVTSIGTSAFRNTGLTSITIPASVTTIGNNAFYLCASLTTVTFDDIANSVLGSIQDEVFRETALTSITIPKSVQTIGDNAFYGCSSLTTVTFDDITNSGLTTIDLQAFQNTALTSITIPASVTTIGNSAFYLCASLTTVTFAAGSTLATFGDYAFKDSGLTSITIPASVTSIGVEAFTGCSSLTTVTFAAGIQLATIRGHAFKNSGITSVTIPASVTSIKEYAFSGCASLATVTFDASSPLATIEQHAFRGTAITTITIPASVTSIDNNVFYQCASLATVTFAAGSTLATIEHTAFSETAITSITIPASVTSMGDNVFYKCSSLASVTFAAGIGIPIIGTNAFRNTAITSITIPASVTTIEEYAFYQCASLASVTFASGNTLATIGTAAFSETGLTSITIPASVTGIGTNAFMNCSFLTTITFATGSTLASIGSQAFRNTALTSITIPASVTTIGNAAFSMCASLTTVTLNPSANWNTSGITSMGSNTFDTSNSLATVVIKDGQVIAGTSYSVGTTGSFFGSPATTILGSFAPIISTALAVNADNTSATITFDKPAYKSDGTTRLTATELVPTIASGTATLSSYTVSTTDDTTFTFALTLSGTSDGSEVLTLTGTVYGYGAIASTAISTTVSFNDLAPATLSSVSLVSDHTDTTKAGIGSKITLAFTASEQIQTPTVAFKVGNTAVTGSITITNTGGNDWSAVYYIGSTHPSGVLAYTIDHSDIAGNQGAQVATGTGSVTVDVVRPTFTSISIAANNNTTSLAKPGNDVTLTMTASETIQSPTVVFTSGSAAVNDTTPTIANTSGDTWTATYTTNIADTDGSVAFTITYIDIYGNAASAVAAAVTDGSSVTFDKTLPGVSSFVMDDVALKNGDTATVSLTFSEAVPGFDSDSYITVANGTMTTMISNAQNIVWTAVFTPTAALESVTNVLTLTSGYTDTSGNVSTHADVQSANYTIDTIQPVLASVTPITFNGTTTIIDRTPSYVFSSTQGGTITTSNATFSSTTTAVSGNNTITFDQLADYTTHDAITIIVTDPAGNPSTALTVPSFTVDTTTSTLDVITKVSNDATFTNTLNTIGANHTDKTVELHATTNPHASYKARITLPNGDFTALTEANKNTIKSTVTNLYATELDIVASDTIFVDILEGSIIIDVYVMTTAAVNSNIQICFPKGTPVTTNQGEMPIEDLIPGVHTIRGKKITAITCTQSNTSDIVLIKKNALGKNIPCIPTQISNHHRVFYKGNMVKASDLVNICKGVVKIPYNGETLYNVVMKKHDKMIINNLICETLHPENVMAKICAGNYTHREKVELCNILKRIGKTNDYNAYNKFYATLK